LYSNQLPTKNFLTLFITGFFVCRFFFGSSPILNREMIIGPGNMRNSCSSPFIFHHWLSRTIVESLQIKPHNETPDIVCKESNDFFYCLRSSLSDGKYFGIPILWILFQFGLNLRTNPTIHKCYFSQNSQSHSNFYFHIKLFVIFLLARKHIVRKLFMRSCGWFSMICL
jgi:hypothetical protein